MVDSASSPSPSSSPPRLPLGQTVLGLGKGARGNSQGGSRRAARLDRALGLVGRVLKGKWRLDEVLGIGGMGMVFTATHRNGFRGAIKMLHPELAKDATCRARFLREAYVANRFSKGVAAILDDDETEDGIVYFVMELLEGCTVGELARKTKGRRLEVSYCASIGLSLLDVLEEGHLMGVVHRDVKPDNLFFTIDGELKVLDFGVSFAAFDGGWADAGVRKKVARLTTNSASLGTPAYMAPEQALCRWDSVGPASDVYSVGATLFSLVAGRAPHGSLSAGELALAVATKPAPSLRSVATEVPAGFAEVVDKALQFKIEDRYPSARAMRAALASWLLLNEHKEVRVPGAVGPSQHPTEIAVQPRPSAAPTRSGSEPRRFDPEAVTADPSELAFGLDLDGLDDLWGLLGQIAPPASINPPSSVQPPAAPSVPPAEAAPLAEAAARPTAKGTLVMEVDPPNRKGTLVMEVEPIVPSAPTAAAARPGSNPEVVLGRPGSNPDVALARSGSNPEVVLGRPGSNPDVVLARPGSNPEVREPSRPDERERRASKPELEPPQAERVPSQPDASLVLLQEQAAVAESRRSSPLLVTQELQLEAPVVTSSVVSEEEAQVLPAYSAELPTYRPPTAIAPAPAPAPSRSRALALGFIALMIVVLVVEYFVFK